MAKVNEPVWSYGGVKALTSVDYGQTTQPVWSYGGSVLQNSMPTEVTVDGPHWTYGLVKLLTGADTAEPLPGTVVTSTVAPKWWYGLSSLLHKLVPMQVARTGRLRAAHVWVSTVMKRRGRF